MREPWVSEDDALRERMSAPDQTVPDEPEAELPPYATSFLAHLRLLIGVSFEYLVPDPALLPDESIRFFHLDRSWTDRLVDGVLAVGKVGSREQAHHQGAAPALDARLDAVEPAVRPVQRGLRELVATADEASDPAISGFVLRSALVAGWPHLDVRAYRNSQKLVLLRLERLSAAVLFALFAGVPDRIELEEPHHGLQFGVTGATTGNDFAIDPRSGDGHRLPGLPFPVGVRQTDPELRVVELADLRRIVSYRADLEDPAVPTQTGSAALAVQLLRPPWKEVFSDEGAHPQPAVLRVSAGPSVPALSAEDLDRFLAAADTLQGEQR
jgi:hypothetical protein